MTVRIMDLGFVLQIGFDIFKVVFHEIRFSQIGIFFNTFAP